MSERHIFRVVKLMNRDAVTLRDAIQESSDIETRLAALRNVASLVKENGAAVMPSYISKGVAEILSSDKTQYERLQIATCRDIDSKMLSSLVGDRVVQEFAIRTLSSASSRLLLANENVNDVQLARVALSLLPQPKTTWKEDDSDKALVSFLSLLLIQNKDLKRELQECTDECKQNFFPPHLLDMLRYKTMCVSQFPELLTASFDSSDIRSIHKLVRIMEFPSLILLFNFLLDPQ